MPETNSQFGTEKGVRSKRRYTNIPPGTRNRSGHPETSIHAGDTDGNPKTEADPSYAPFVAKPCFPSYPSNHGSAGNGAAEVLRRLYGEAGHSITLTNPAVPNVVLRYTSFKQLTNDIADARVYGGIHFRSDQEAGAEAVPTL